MTYNEYKQLTEQILDNPNPPAPYNNENSEWANHVLAKPFDGLRLRDRQKQDVIVEIKDENEV